MSKHQAEALNESQWIRPTTAGRMLNGMHRNTVLNRAVKGQYRYKVIDGTTYVFRPDIEKAARQMKRERAAA